MIVELRKIDDPEPDLKTIAARHRQRETERETEAETETDRDRKRQRQTETERDRDRDTDTDTDTDGDGAGGCLGPAEGQGSWKRQEGPAICMFLLSETLRLQSASETKRSLLSLPPTAPVG